MSAGRSPSRSDASASWPSRPCRALTEALADKDDGVKAAAAEALGRVGAEARAAAPDLLKLAATADKPLRQAVAFALGRIDPDDRPPVAAALVALLKSATEAELRREIVTSLGLLGETAGDVVPALAAQLADRDAEHRLVAIDALGKLGPAVGRVQAELLALFESDPDKAVRQTSIRALGKGLGPDAARLIPALTQRLHADADFEVRVAIAQELGGLGANGKPAVPALRVAQRDPQIRVREAATAAIKQIERCRCETPDGSPEAVRVWNISPSKVVRQAVRPASTTLPSTIEERLEAEPTKIG